MGAEKKTRTPAVGMITIVHHPRPEELRRFIKNINELKFQNLIFLFVIDKDFLMRREWSNFSFPNALFIKRFYNIGTAYAWNAAAKRLLSNNIDYIGLWNTDVKLHRNCLCALLKIFKLDFTIGAVAPLLFYSDEPNKVQMYGGSIDIITGIGKHDYNGVTDLNNLPPIRDAQYLDGGTMLIRADVLRKIGGFDEKLFMYYEDSDLCVRIQRAGYRTVVVRDAWAWHYHRENKGRYPPSYEIYYITRNRFYFILKHAGGGFALRAFIDEMIKAPRKVIFFLKHLKPVLVVAYLKGLLDGILFRMGKRGFVN